MELKSFFVSALLIGLFIIAILNFGLHVANNNDVDNILTEDSALNTTFQAMEAQLESAEDNATAQKGGFFTDVPLFGAAGPVFQSIWGTVTTFFSMVIGIFNSIFTLLASIGIPPLVTGVFAAIVIIVVLFLIWQVWRTGK